MWRERPQVRVVYEYFTQEVSFAKEWCGGALAPQTLPGLTPTRWRREIRRAVVAEALTVRLTSGTCARRCRRLLLEKHDRLLQRRS